MRINKFLASAGIGSRRKVEELITNGLITINGEVVSNLATDVLETDTVEYKGKKVVLNENRVYFILNKPKCYITSVSDEKGRIGEGTHERFIIQSEKFQKKADQKLQA